MHTDLRHPNPSAYQPHTDFSIALHQQANSKGSSTCPLWSVHQCHLFHLAFNADSMSVMDMGSFWSFKWSLSCIYNRRELVNTLRYGVINISPPVPNQPPKTSSRIGSGTQAVALKRITAQQSIVADYILQHKQSIKSLSHKIPDAKYDRCKHHNNTYP